MQKTKPLILIAEDDTQLTEVLSKQLSLSGLNVQVFQNGADMVDFLKRHFASVILLDINLPDVDGFNIVRQLRNAGISIPVIFLTGFSDE
ncbi:MAG: response regulator, partial [Puniceicoccales bacterium]|nr:response regulator [Puniceicoccales bacterium]